MRFLCHRPWVIKLTLLPNRPCWPCFQSCARAGLVIYTLPQQQMSCSCCKALCNQWGSATQILCIYLWWWCWWTLLKVCNYQKSNVHKHCISFVKLKGKCDLELKSHTGHRHRTFRKVEDLKDKGTWSEETEKMKVQDEWWRRPMGKVSE